jgi:hypothetical protein
LTNRVDQNPQLVSTNFCNLELKTQGCLEIPNEGNDVMIPSNNNFSDKLLYFDWHKNHFNGSNILIDLSQSDEDERENESDLKIDVDIDILHGAVAADETKKDVTQIVTRSHGASNESTKCSKDNLDNHTLLKNKLTNNKTDDQIPVTLEMKKVNTKEKYRKYMREYMREYTKNRRQKSTSTRGKQRKNRKRKLKKKNNLRKNQKNNYLDSVKIVETN